MNYSNMRELRNIVIKYNTVIIFGASDLGKIIKDDLLEDCARRNISICFADNSNKKWNNEVFSPQEAKNFLNSLWIVASDRYAIKMRQQLLDMGVSDSDIIIEVEKYITIKNEAEKKRRMTPHDHLIELDVDLAHHCNLNCAGCNAFSPIITKSVFADINVFSRDMERLSFLFEKHLDVLHLLGGEPLLHPDINKFSITAREFFPNTKIGITTNGLLLPKMPPAFWQTCAEQKILVSVTRYPINLDFNKIRKIAEYYNTDFEFYGIDVGKTTHFYPFDVTGSQDINENFATCFMANMCCRIRNGNMSSCCVILNVEFFNSYFGTNMTVTPDDYINIYEAKSGREILEFLAKPVPFCRFCDVKHRTYDNPWHRSKRGISEWIIEK